MSAPCTTLAAWLLAFAAGAAADSAPLALTQERQPEVVLRRQPLDPEAYPAPLREALLGLGAGRPSGLRAALQGQLGGGQLGGGDGVTLGSLDLLTLFIPQTGITESYLFYEPFTPTPPTPLLVHFHAANVSAYDLVFFTDFLDEAEARQWYVLAPFQLVPTAPVTNSYSSLPSQFHVEEVLLWALGAHPNIDLDRIYGYGFSMGGGNALNFAARHLDRARGTFAALVNHTGTLCLTDEYINALSPSVVQPVLEARFGGTPATARYSYQRSSVLDLDNSSELVLGGAHVGVNLAHVPLQSWVAVDDPQAHLVRQARRFYELMALVPGARHELFERPGNSHRWDTLDEFLVCEWFAAQSLTVPRRGELRVDRSAKFHALEVTVASTERLARLFHDARAERFSLTQTDNVVEVRVNAAEGGLDPARVPFEVLVDSAAGAPARVVITGFTRTPAGVTRDGASTTTGFVYDAGSQTLTVEESAAGTHLYRFF